MPTWIAKIELAKRAGVTRAAITKAARVAFPDAVLGNQVDVDHPDTLEYLRRARRDSTLPPEVPVPAPSEPTAPRPAAVPREAEAKEPPALVPPPAAATSYSLPESMAPYADWTLRALVEKHGTMRQFESALVSWKKLLEGIDKESKISERLGRLIPRELVRKHVFSMIEAAFRRLLTDTPIAIVRRVYAAARANLSEEEAEKVVRELISSQLLPLKAGAERALRTPDQTDTEAA